MDLVVGALASNGVGTATTRAVIRNAHLHPIRGLLCADLDQQAALLRGASEFQVLRWIAYVNPLDTPTRLDIKPFGVGCHRCVTRSDSVATGACRTARHS